MQPPSVAHSNAMATTDRMPRRRRTLAPDGLETVIRELAPSSCVTRGVDVPGRTSDSNTCELQRISLQSLPEDPMMLWPFNHFLKPRTPLRGTIEVIYGMIVAQAREPVFYQA